MTTGSRLRLGWMLACALALAACDKHEHGHDDEHENENEGEAAHDDEQGHDHASEHPEGHDHHAEAHGHEQAMLRITLWSDRFELFAEHAPAVAGRELELLVHVTVLDGFRAAANAGLRLELDGPAPVRAQTDSALRPGIHLMRFTAPTAGTYRGVIDVTGPVAGRVEGFELTVHADAKTALAAAPEEDEGAPIEFLKEQQWSVPFATAFAEQRTIAAAIEVAGTVDTPPGGSAEVGAPVPGRIAAPPRGLPRPGAAVRKGQLLALLSPAPAAPEDAARASLAVAEAEARRAAAQSALERNQRLIADQAASLRELEDAQRELRVADEAVRAARNAADLFAGASSGQGRGSWRLLAPIAGTLVSVDATPGASVSAGHVLFRILDPRELWIRARVPEQDAARMRADRDVRYQIAGDETWRTIRVGDNGATGSVVSTGRTVDPKTRTVDVIYALRDPDPALRVGGLVRVAIPAGEEFTGIVVPRSALVDQDGREVIYVQLDGEHFAARPVRTGPRSGDAVAVQQGLDAGERIVTRGAHLVRLADRPKGGEPHGHIH
jgi:membrane fusion protein, heavy metal efflux system